MGNAGSRHLAATVAALLTAAPASAAEWWYVNFSADQVFYYVDVESMQPVGRNVQAWEWALRDKAKDGIISAKIHILFDCVGKRSQIISSFAYGPDGSVVNSGGRELFIDIVPETIGDGVMRFACAAPAQRGKLGTKLSTTPEQATHMLTEAANTPQ